jgi:glycerol uptake facilitator-like aquaporin
MLTDLWMFWLAPILGAILAGVVHVYVIQERAETVEGH